MWDTFMVYFCLGSHVFSIPFFRHLRNPNHGCRMRIIQPIMPAKPREKKTSRVRGVTVKTISKGTKGVCFQYTNLSRSISAVGQIPVVSSSLIFSTVLPASLNSTSKVAASVPTLASFMVAPSTETWKLLMFCPAGKPRTAAPLSIHVYFNSTGKSRFANSCGLPGSSTPASAASVMVGQKGCADVTVTNRAATPKSVCCTAIAVAHRCLWKWGRARSCLQWGETFSLKCSRFTYLFAF